MKLAQVSKDKDHSTVHSSITKVKNRTILQGDVLEKIREVPDECIDCVVTDPPYGYGFMNKDWDKVLIGVNVWKECLRVLKPGAFAFIMSAPRQDVLYRAIQNLELAGFEIGYTSMYWAYASGFPKAMNISKAVDKKLGFEPEKSSEKPYSSPDFSEEQFTNQGSMMHTHQTSKRIQCYNTKPVSGPAKRLAGSYAGFQPKPALEVIIVCMKPLSKRNYVEQALTNGKGVTWLDDCRIPTTDEIKPVIQCERSQDSGLKIESCGFNKNGLKILPHGCGRFPANLLISGDSLDVGKKTKSKRNLMKPDGGGTGNSLRFHDEIEELRGFDDGGDFSRYFSLDSWEAQFIIAHKPSKSEKNEGLEQYLSNQDKFGGKFLTAVKLAPKQVNDGRKNPPDNPFQRGKTIRQNTHPTVKPVSLFKFLVTLGTRPNDFVLDPFMGSGTTAIACEQLARNWIGVELNEEYCEITKARIDDYRKQMRLIN